MTQDKGGEMMFQRWRTGQGLFAPRPAVLAGRALNAAITEQARRPVFYIAGAVPDTPTGRFELAALHLALVVRRLRDGDAFAAETSQALFDAFLSRLDDGLRELGVGDLTVPKTMRRLAEALYGRFRNLDAALAAPGDDELVVMLRRTLYGGSADGPAEALAAYVRRADRALASTALEALTTDGPVWPEPAFESVAA